jgi:hypothetical protein
VLIDDVPVLPGEASPPLPIGKPPAPIHVTLKVPGARTYSLQVAPSALGSTYMKASNADSGDGFGAAVALSGNTLVVGAPGESSSARGVNGDQNANNSSLSGAVYVFRNTPKGWVQEAYLKALNNRPVFNFGASLALSGDTLIVGAPGESGRSKGVNGDPEDQDLTSSGAVYVFQRSGSLWTQTAYIKASTPHVGDRFGSTLALSGDTLAVGAPLESSGARGVNGDQGSTSVARSGAVYVFSRSGPAWIQQAYVKASDTTADDQFGTSLALSGDILAIGAPRAANYAGAVYLFERSGALWAQQLRLPGSSITRNGSEIYVEEFGSSLALEGNTLAIGAPAEASLSWGVNPAGPRDTASDNSGTVYVFQRTPKGAAALWEQTTFIKAENVGAYDRFGVSVALSEGGLAVGAPGESSNGVGADGINWDNSLPGAGAVYIYRTTGSGWRFHSYLKAPAPDQSDHFGRTLALAGDSLVVGTSDEDGSASGIGGDQRDNRAPGSGAAYLFR